MQQQHKVMTKLHSIVS